MIADRVLAGSLFKLQSNCGLEPLPTFIEERDAGDWSIADMSRYLRNAVELNFRFRIQNVEVLERSKAIDFLPTRQIVVTMTLYHSKTARWIASELFRNVGLQPTQRSGIMPRALARSVANL
ncbi:hypothetical protein VB618_03980 [Microvirga sp. CF3062]|uniref:hypothetical protein n=1 Tax=Microvirga sp. CF3062 TaxID=3110182 RepID=UPI002E7728C6|nr:hypothetical protein [Microvirga sp. CF3062]MEE1655345.1 hypothetical protein [Microvirga sp. CF3062]